MAKYNGPFTIIPQTGVDGSFSSVFGRQARSFDTKISSFGSLEFGVANSVDYTKLTFGFASKDNIQNPVVPSFSFFSEYIRNPYLWGSTIIHSWHDEARVMTLGARTMDGDRLPMKDVMDTKASKSNPTDAGTILNWPMEGYRPLGGRTGGPFDYEVGAIE